MKTMKNHAIRKERSSILSAKATKKPAVRKPRNSILVAEAMKKPTVRKAPSSILAAIHETVDGLHREGVVGKATMRDFDALCLTPVIVLAPKEIAAIRKGERVSQPVFASYLNVDKSSVSKWERGEKKPDGAALKLLNLVKNKGLKAIA